MNSVVAPVNARALSRVDHAVDPQTADSARCIVDLKPPPGADALSGLPRKRAIDKASSQGGRDRAESSTGTPAGDSCGAQHTPARSVSSRATAQRRPRYRAALEQKPDLRLALFNLELAAEQRGDLNPAVAECKQAVRAAPAQIHGTVQPRKAYEHIWTVNEQPAANAKRPKHACGAREEAPT